jgi:hypothetical protein
LPQPQFEAFAKQSLGARRESIMGKRHGPTRREMLLAATASIAAGSLTNAVEKLQQGNSPLRLVKSHRRGTILVQATSAARIEQYFFPFFNR